VCKRPGRCPETRSLFAKCEAKMPVKSNLRLIFKILCYLFCKKGNAKKLYKGSKEFWKVFFGSFFYRKTNRHFLILYRFLLRMLRILIQIAETTVSGGGWGRSHQRCDCTTFAESLAQMRKSGTIKKTIF
jgi:hypothetical protein